MQTQVYGCQLLSNFYNAVYYFLLSHELYVSDLSELNYDYVYSNTNGQLTS